MRTFRAVKDPGEPVPGLSPGWDIEKRRWYGWQLVNRWYGDEDGVKKYLGELACPQIVTVRASENGEGSLP